MMGCGRPDMLFGGALSMGFLAGAKMLITLDRRGVNIGLPKGNPINVGVCLHDPIHFDTFAKSLNYKQYGDLALAEQTANSYMTCKFLLQVK